MKDSDELFLLIKSLSSSEKRYFKLFASQAKKEENNYVLLFDFMDRFGEQNYDENILKQRLRKHSFVKQLHVTKNYLYQLILKSLRNYYNISCESRLQELLKDAEFLFRKKLYKQCEKILLKAEEMAVQNERYTYLYEVYKFQERILSYLSLSAKEEIECLQQLALKRKETMLLLGNQEEYRDIWFKLYTFSKEFGFEIRNKEMERKLMEIMNHPLLLHPKTALCFESLRFYYTTYNTYYSIVNDIEQAVVCNKKLLELYEQSETRIRNNLKAYIAAFYNYTNRCIYSHRIDELEKSINKFKAIPSLYADVITKEQEEEIVIFLVVQELVLFQMQGRYDEAEKWISVKQQDIIHLENINDKRWLVYLYYYIAYVYFVRGKYKLSLQWINKLLNGFHEDFVPQWQSYARVLKLILYYELGYTDLMEHVIRSTYRFLLKKNRLLDTERIVLNGLRKIPHTDKPKEIKLFFSFVREELKKVGTDRINYDYKNNLDLLAWVESKINDVSLEIIVKQNKEFA